MGAGSLTPQRCDNSTMAASSQFGNGRIRYLFLFARDFERLLAFYRDVLGLTPL